MGGIRVGFGVISFLFACTGYAGEAQLVKIHVDGIRISKNIEVPNGDYEILAVTNDSGIYAIRYHGTNARGEKPNLYIPMSQIVGANASFVQTPLPGNPHAFAARADAGFDPVKGGVIHLRALTGWAGALFKNYSYTDFSIAVDYEAGTVRTSLLSGGKSQKLSKINVTVNLLSAFVTTE